MSKFNAYIKLMRLDKLIPILLILYPTLWALIIASKGNINFKIFIVFILGVIIMRTLGCVINDFLDIKYDKKVESTKLRPLANGDLNKKNALAIIIILLISAFLLVLNLNNFTIYLSFIALFLASFYPLCKRFFPYPQLFLGLAFNFGIIMSFSAINNYIPLNAFLLYLAVIIWTTAYDTIYAISDLKYDKKLNLKSSAIYFGKYVNSIIIILNYIFIFLMFIFGLNQNFNSFYFIALFLCIPFFHYQKTLFKTGLIKNCIKAFYNNHYIGLIILIAIIFQY